jgi:hypothetical protein
MGFLKRFTGGAGTIEMQLSGQQVRRGESVEVTLRLAATGPLSGKGVHLELVGEEEVRVRRHSTSSSAELTGTTDSRTYEQRFTLDPSELRLNAGEAREYRGTVQVPLAAQPTYRGVNATHTWKVRGFVDVTMGQDVDAEVEIEVS